MRTKSASILKFTACWTALPIVILIFATICAAQAKLGDPAPAFALTDQYDKTRQLSDFRASLVILVDSDSSGNQFNSAWTRPLQARYNSPQLLQLRFVIIANLASVPGFMHNYVKGKFISKDPTHPNGSILLDWEGMVAKSYGFHADVSNIYFVDRDGILRFTAFGKGASTELEPLFQAIDKAIAEAPPAAKPI